MTENAKARSASGMAISGKLLLVIPVVALLWAMYWLQQEASTPVLRLVIQGETLELDGEGQKAFSEALEAELSRSEQAVMMALEAWTEERLDTAFASLEDTLDSYLDWHFSMTGSYGRLLAALGGRLEDWSGQQLQKRLLEPAGFEDHLRRVQSEFPGQLADARQQGLNQAKWSLLEQFDRYQTRRDLPGDEQAGQGAGLDLDEISVQLMDAGFDQARLAGSSGIAVGAGAMAISRRLALTPAMQQARALVARAVARLGVQAGRSAALSGGAGAASAPAGPGALVIGGVVFATSLAAFAGTEYLALNAQEKALRPELEASLKQEFTHLREELETRLQTAALASTRQLSQTFLLRADEAHQSLLTEEGESRRWAPSRQYRVFGGAEPVPEV